mmetsp:Transcript_10825/g.15417  ORF Transcript_10825/g.15417 Transcript_10825/m.15417 type:complete len:82 (+) Transcript_10825:398-643(+)|eukprot:scaffold101486_cov28-Tisochrysis_lutea.AAC.2
MSTQIVKIGGQEPSEAWAKYFACWRVAVWTAGAEVERDQQWRIHPKKAQPNLTSEGRACLVAYSNRGQPEGSVDYIEYMSV